MPLRNPPFYKYPLFDPWDSHALQQISTIGQSKSYPLLQGPESAQNKFLTTLVRSQKSFSDWRALAKEVMQQIAESNVIQADELIKKYPPESIGKGSVEWATYREDQIVSDFIDELADREVRFIGTGEQVGEFIVRFILGQLGNDWELTLLMIWEMLGNGSSISLTELNSELKKFDYLGLL